MHNGYPSTDNGFGCMDLVKNSRTNTLDEAASLLHVSENQVKIDMTANIQGGASVLRQDALKLSPNHHLPTNLAGWYGAVALYSHASTKASATMYANAVYALMNKGFTATSDTGEQIALAPVSVVPNKKTANHLAFQSVLPRGCMADGNTDYPGAIDCMLDPGKYDCNTVESTAPCTYEDANRPLDLPIQFIVIHGMEGPLSFAFSIFHNSANEVSIHYIVDTDGTVYQLVPEKDVSYQSGNYWYNQRSIGIEHTSFQQSGFTWYSAGEYLGSARLSAYLAKKYAIPLDHDHIVSHGTIPPPTLAEAPNHLDPGPYWQWDYYFSLIHQQGVAYPTEKSHSHIISLHPLQNILPFSPNGTVYPAYFNFFSLYNGPGTGYVQIPSSAPITTGIDVTNTIEPDISYYYLGKVKDTEGSGMTEYHLWYGENDAIIQPSVTAIMPAHQNPSILDNPLIPFIGIANDDAIPSVASWFTNAKLVWLAAPQDAVEQGSGTAVKLTSSQGSNPVVYGAPINKAEYIIGNAPKGTIFVSAFTENETQIVWYEINYNHRQAWIPASEISVL